MPPADVDDDYFNDLSRQPNISTTSSASPQDQNGASETCDPNELPKTKRIACVICRKRKLKCDGTKPKCSTCARLGHNCAYDEVRRKSGPKRGYVKELEARLAQVETQLQGKESKTSKAGATKSTSLIPEEDDLLNSRFPPMEKASQQMEPQLSMPQQPFERIPPTSGSYSMPISDMAPEAVPMSIPDFDPSLNFTLDSNFSWEMIGLGLEEPMPTQDAIDELTSIYFEKIHPTLPMLHKYRYYATMNLSPQARPPICLRYIMWCLASSITDKYMHHQDIFYRRARKYIELDEMKGAGEAYASLAHGQTWSLICTYEFKMMYFPRAWMSCGRAARLALMMSLNRVDGIGMDAKQCLPPPRDWTEKEERRRTFWMAYCVDRYASIGTGWPMSIDDRDILTDLPASEEAYESGTEQKAPPLNDAMTHEQVVTLSSFGGVVYVTHFFGMNLTHLHRPESDDQEDNLQGKFWRRHRKMDNVLLQTSLSLPSHLRLPSGVRNPNVVFLNFAIHASTICLHQAAIFKAEKNQLPSALIDQSRTRCVLAAGEIANVMRLTSHLDVNGMNPFMTFCLYVAARVFVQHLKKEPNDQETRTALEFLFTAMSALKRKNPLTESFMIQLKLDIEGSGIDPLLHNPDLSSIVKDRIQSGLIVPRGLSATLPSCAAPLNKGESLDENSLDPRSPEDLRFPDVSPIWKRNENNSSSPSIRSDSPRQTQYALRNIELLARDSGQVNSMYSENGIAPSQFREIFPGSTWTDRPNDNGPVGLNPLINNNINNNTFDTEMADNMAQTSPHNSSGLTPQSSSNYMSSSNTSYSPPQVQDEDANQPKSMPHVGSSWPNSGGEFGPQHPIFTPPAAVSPNSTNNNNNNSNTNGQSPQATQNDPFKIPAGWDMNGAGMTPDFSGMTPGGEWDKMMQNISWDESLGMMSPK